MKLIMLLFLFLTIVSYYSVSCYGYMRHDYPTERILQDSGDVSLPPNSFQINSIYTVYYQFDNGPDTPLSATSDPPVEEEPQVQEEPNESGNNGTWPSINSLSERLQAGSSSSEGSNNTNSTDNAEETPTTTPTPVDPTYITLAIVFEDPGQFFAIGWGSRGMIGGDIWAFEIIDGGVRVTDRKAVGHFEPPLDSDQGGSNDVELLGYSITDTSTTVKVRRKMDTGDSNDAVIQPGENRIIWATANGHPTIEYHGNTKGSLTQNLVSK